MHVASMTTKSDEQPVATSFTSATMDLAIRLGFLGLVGYWSLKVIAPLLTIFLWSAILTVALYPLFDLLARWLDSRRLAAAVVALLCLLVVVGPITWLGYGLIGGVGSLISGLEVGQGFLPLPAETVKGWPLVGERLHHLWSLAANNMKAVLIEVAPQLKPVGTKLLEMAQSVFFGILELLVSIVIAGFLFNRGPQLVGALGAFLDRALSHSGREMVQLAGSTIRNISRGVVGIALLQSILAGAGFMAAGISAPSALAFVVLLLGLIQIGPAILIFPIVVWSWTAMEATPALIFTAYMVLVGLIDNVLRPILMSRGLTTPMPVIMIGVIGGMVAYGIVGLFFGPVVLSVAWVLMLDWVKQDNAPQLSLGGPELTPTRSANHFDEPNQRLVDARNGS
jgi:predicted PurR-regulated permease PerM